MTSTDPPAEPWHFFHEWGPLGEAIAFEAPDADTLLCLTSITGSNAASETLYLDLHVREEGVEFPPLIFRALLPGLTSLTFPFPTPLVISREGPWRLIAGPPTGATFGGLFQVTLVGYVSHRSRLAQPYREPAGGATTRAAGKGVDRLQKFRRPGEG